MSQALAREERTARRAPLRAALLPALLFWAAWALLRWQLPHARWPSVAAQLWVAYSAAWCVLPWRWWPVGVPLAAAGGALLAGVTLAAPATALLTAGPSAAMRAAVPAFALRSADAPAAALVALA